VYSVLSQNWNAIKTRVGKVRVDVRLLKSICAGRSHMEEAGSMEGGCRLVMGLVTTYTTLDAAGFVWVRAALGCQ
jgi:hypothetical protein